MQICIRFVPAAAANIYQLRCYIPLIAQDLIKNVSMGIQFKNKKQKKEIVSDKSN